MAALQKPLYQHHDQPLGSEAGTGCEANSLSQCGVEDALRTVSEASPAAGEGFGGASPFRPPVHEASDCSPESGKAISRRMAWHGMAFNLLFPNQAWHASGPHVI